MEARNSNLEEKILRNCEHRCGDRGHQRSRSIGYCLHTAGGLGADRNAQAAQFNDALSAVTYSGRRRLGSPLMTAERDTQAT